MKVRVWLISVALLLCGAVDCAAQSSAPYGGAWTMTLENDVFTHSDNNYTNGIGVTWVSNAIDTYEERSVVRRWGKFWSFLPFVGNDGNRTYVSWSLAQEMHTPDDIKNPNPPLDDQPYAGVLYLDSTMSMRKMSVGTCVATPSRRRGPCIARRQRTKVVPRLDRRGRADGLEHAASERTNPQRRIHRRISAGPRGLGPIGLVENHSGGQCRSWQLLHRRRTRPVRRGWMEPRRCPGRNSLCGKGSMRRRRWESGQWMDGPCRFPAVLPATASPITCHSTARCSTTAGQSTPSPSSACPHSASPCAIARWSSSR